jgi:hypothetical protein
MRDKLGTMALESLHIRDPLLAQQWADRISGKNEAIQGDEQIRQELDKEHAPATTEPFAAAAPPATKPATAH